MSAANTTLALDLGTTTGWALRTTDGQVISGTASFLTGRFEFSGMHHLRMRRWLEELAGNNSSPSAVYFLEVGRHAGVDALHVYGGLIATHTALCEQRSIAYALSKLARTPSQSTLGLAARPGSIL